jgi:hypothetical protein
MGTFTRSDSWRQWSPEPFLLPLELMDSWDVEKDSAGLAFSIQTIHEMSIYMPFGSASGLFRAICHRMVQSAM